MTSVLAENSRECLFLFTMQHTHPVKRHVCYDIYSFSFHHMRCESIFISKYNISQLLGKRFILWWDFATCFTIYMKWEIDVMATSAECVAKATKYHNAVATFDCPIIHITGVFTTGLKEDWFKDIQVKSIRLIQRAFTTRLKFLD